MKTTIVQKLEDKSAMVTKNRFGRICSCIQLASIVLYLFFQIGCATTDLGLWRSASCPPTEIVSQLRQSLSNQKNPIPTSDPKSEGKNFVIFTDSIYEQNGKRERRIKYKFVIQPVEDANKSNKNTNESNENANKSTEGANKSTLSLYLEKAEAKGVREKQWYDEETSMPPSGQELWKQIQSICPSEQRQ